MSRAADAARDLASLERDQAPRSRPAAGSLFRAPHVVQIKCPWHFSFHYPILKSFDTRTISSPEPRQYALSRAH